MLRLHAELLQGEVLPRLPFADLGALLLTCKATRDLVTNAPNGALLSAARHSLPSVHPLFTAASAHQYLRDQGRIAEAIAAGPQTWTVETAPSPPGTQFGRVYCAPSFTRAASHRTSRLDVWELSSARELASIPVATPGPAAEGARSESHCVWSDCSQVVACVLKCGQVAMFDAATGQQCTVQLDDKLVYWTAKFLPGQQALLLSVTQSRAVLVRLRPGGLAVTELPFKPIKGWGLRYWGAVSPLGAVVHAGDDSICCIWHAEIGAVEFELRFQPISLAWSPCGTVVLCLFSGKVRLGERSLAFVSAQGHVLARQRLTLPRVYPGHDGSFSGGSLVWGRYDVLDVTGSPNGCQRRSSDIHYYSVQPGPQLQLQHSICLNLRISNGPYLSPNQAHVCVVADSDSPACTVVMLPASPAQAKLYRWTDSHRCRLTASPCGPPLWLSDGSGVLLSPFSPAPGKNAPQLIRFLRL